MKTLKLRKEESYKGLVKVEVGFEPTTTLSATLMSQMFGGEIVIESTPNKMTVLVEYPSAEVAITSLTRIRDFNLQGLNTWNVDESDIEFLRQTHL